MLSPGCCCNAGHPEQRPPGPGGCWTEPKGDIAFDTCDGGCAKHSNQHHQATLSKSLIEWLDASAVKMEGQAGRRFAKGRRAGRFGSVDAGLAKPHAADWTEQEIQPGHELCRGFSLILEQNTGRAEGGEEGVVGGLCRALEDSSSCPGTIFQRELAFPSASLARSYSHVSCGSATAFAGKTDGSHPRGYR